MTNSMPSRYAAKPSRTSESADDQIGVTRRSAALVAVDEFAREAADRCVALHGLRTVEGEQRLRQVDAIEPLPDLRILHLRPWLNSPCRTVVR
jgi:hypothetical protein